jgi:hypothetical protein
MTPLLGVSSSSVPHASAAELLRGAAALGARCLDLRAGRRQAWEPRLEDVATGLPVAFVGVGHELGGGVPASPMPARMMEVVCARRIPVRFFCGALADQTAVSRFAQDVECLRGAWGPDLLLAVEPHAAQPTLAQLDEVLAEHGIGAVLDILGLIHLGARLDEARAFLRRHAVAVQVKGVVAHVGSYQHVALATVPSLAAWAAALVDGTHLPVTIETKAGTAGEDIRTLSRAIELRAQPARADRRLEAPACACA